MCFHPQLIRTLEIWKSIIFPTNSVSKTAASSFRQCLCRGEILAFFCCFGQQAGCWWSTHSFWTGCFSVFYLPQIGLVQKNKQPKTLVLRFLDRNLNDNPIQPIVLIKYFWNISIKQKRPKKAFADMRLFKIIMYIFFKLEGKIPTFSRSHSRQTSQIFSV